jgi:hypothetical protein
MSALDLIGLVVVLLVAAVVVVLVLRRRSTSRSSAQAGPRTVADLVRMRAEQSAAASHAPNTTANTTAKTAAAPGARPGSSEPGTTGSGATSAAGQGASASTGGAAAAQARVPVPQQAGAEQHPDPAPVVPAQATRPRQKPPVPIGAAATEKWIRVPGPDLTGADTPWHRAALMAAGGGAGSWQPPPPVVPVPPVTEPVPLRVVPPAGDAGPGPGPGAEPPADQGGWAGWADWAEVDAEEAEEEAARSARRSEAAAQVPARPRDTGVREQGKGDPAPAAQPGSSKIPTAREAAPAPVPTPHPEPEAEPMVRPVGKRTPEERAAEQAAADVALLRTFGFADSDARPDTAPVVAMVRPDAQEGAAADKGAAQPVRFHVVGRDGGPVAGAAVALLDDRGLEVAGATAGTDGRGEVLAPAAGVFALVATSRGHQPNVVAVTVAEEPVGVEALLARSAALVGSVEGEDGPISGARVALVQDGEVIEAATTDDEGAYRMEDIASGEYGLTVAAAGFVPVAAVVEVPDEAELRRDVVLEPASPTTEYGSSGLGDDDGFGGVDGIDGMMTGQRFS